jgi:hypothetical protein
LTIARNIFTLTFSASPIILTGGLASFIPGGLLPIIALTDAVSFVGGIFSGSDVLDSDNFFAKFTPLPGSTLIEQQVATYPFANRNVAANATIQQPLNLSMLMICPAGPSGGYLTKLATMVALQASLDQHNKLGGLYTVMTPAGFYTDLILTSVSDVSNAATHQAQNAYKFDFTKPLISLASAQQAENALMNTITNGGLTDGAQSGLSMLAGSSSAAQAPALFNGAAGAGAVGLS